MIPIPYIAKIALGLVPFIVLIAIWVHLAILHDRERKHLWSEDDIHDMMNNTD